MANDSNNACIAYVICFHKCKKIQKKTLGAGEKFVGFETHFRIKWCYGLVKFHEAPHIPAPKVFSRVERSTLAAGLNFGNGHIKSFFYVIRCKLGKC
jgi:hypothetical protein